MWVVAIKTTKLTTEVTLLALLIISLQANITFGIGDYWPYPRHDTYNTGFSNSQVPSTNQTAWLSKDIAAIAPIVADGKVYCTGGKYVNLTILDEATGAVIWTKSLGSFSTPTVSSGVVYVGTLGGEIWALNSTNGEIIWKYSIYGYSEPLDIPLVADGKVFFNDRDGWLFCINQTNAQFIWKYETALAEVAHLAIDGDRLFTMNSCLNATDGTLLWQYGEKPSGIHYSYHTPTVDEGKVFLSIGPSIHAVDELRGTVIWGFNSTGDTSDVAIGYGKVIVSDGGNLYCLNETNGSEEWRYQEDFNWFSSIPTIADNKIVVPAYDKVLCLDANNGSLLWTYYGIRSQGQITIAGNMVFFASTDGIVALGNPRVPELTPISWVAALALITVMAAVTIRLKRQRIRMANLRKDT
jgi:eukaryotic-like serine/threonine-protein kinase